MAWRRPGDMPLSDPVMVRLWTRICVTGPQWIEHPFPMPNCCEILHKHDTKNAIPFTKLWFRIVFFEQARIKILINRIWWNVSSISPTIKSFQVYITMRSGLSFRCKCKWDKCLVCTFLCVIVLRCTEDMGIFFRLLASISQGMSGHCRTASCRATRHIRMCLRGGMHIKPSEIGVYVFKVLRELCS